LLDNQLSQINASLQNIDKEIRNKLLLKLQLKQRQEGKKNISDADERRWKLPIEKFEHWEVPFDTDDLYPVEFNIDADSPIQGIDEDLETFDQATNAVSFIENILSLLKREGVIFPGNRKMNFNELRLYDSGGTMINFEGSWMNGDNKVRKVAVSVGPQHGPITGWQVENVIRTAYKHGFDDIVFAGLSFTAEATAAIEDETNPNVKLHLTHISNDIQMGDLLKSTGIGQIFTVMGSP